LQGVAYRTVDTMVLPFHMALGATDSIAIAAMMRSIWQDDLGLPAGRAGEVGEVAGYWHNALLPVGDDGTGDTLVADLRGGPRRGRIFYFDKVDADLRPAPA